MFGKILPGLELLGEVWPTCQNLPATAGRAGPDGDVLVKNGWLPMGGSFGWFG